MKKVFILSALIISTYSIQAQSFGKALKSVSDKVSGENKSGLSNSEIVDGLKEALEIGAEKAVTSASAVDGFNKNPKIYIPFPEEAEAVKSAAVKLGQSEKVEVFEEKMNRAAEQATKEATSILVNAITSMSVQDGYNILRGDDNAATKYLKSTSEEELKAKFQPIVNKAIADVDLMKYWEPLAKAYNTTSRFTGKSAVDPDLEVYVTQKAIDGLFVLIAEQEAKIRNNPAEQVTATLKKVFGQ